MSRDKNYLDRGLWTSERVGYLLEEAASRWPERECLRFEDRRFSFQGLHHWVLATAIQLRERGVQTGDRVLIQSGNCMELIVVHMAAWRIGAISVPVVPVYRTHEMRAILDSTQPTVVAAARASGSRQPYVELDQLLSESSFSPKVKYLFGVGEDIPGWATVPPPGRHAASAASAPLPEPGPADQCCMILFTSGTTSAPKGAVISSRAILSGIKNWQLGLEVSSEDVTVAGAPLTHVAALMSAFLVPLSLGARTVVMPAWNAERAVALIEEERATYMAGATIFLHDLVELYEKGHSPHHRLRAFTSGGAATPPALIERAERLGIKASRVYGMTETCGPVVQSSKSVPLAIRANVDGRISYGAELEIVDDDRRPLPPHQLGEIRIRTPQLMDGYLDQQVTSTQLDADGWFYPGDLGVMDEAGWLTVSGRKKDIINRGGEKFSAMDIEAALIAYEPILKAAVIGMPDTRLGEVVCACLVLRPGQEWAGPKAVLAHLETYGLARPKFPVEWVLLDELPVTATGKVQKQILLKTVLEKRSTAVQP